MPARAGTGTAAMACLAWLVVFGIATLLPSRWPISTEGSEVSVEPGPPRLELSIEMRDFLLIQELRDRAVEEGFLFRTENDMVPGVIDTQGPWVSITQC